MSIKIDTKIYHKLKMKKYAAEFRLTYGSMSDAKKPRKTLLQTCLFQPTYTDWAAPQLFAPKIVGIHCLVVDC